MKKIRETQRRTSREKKRNKRAIRLRTSNGNSNSFPINNYM